MAMSRTAWVAGLLAVAALLVAAAQAPAGETLRLALDRDDAPQLHGVAGGVDTLLVHGWRGYRGYYGYRGYHGYPRYYGYRGYSPYRSFGFSFGFSYYRPRYYGYYYAPRAYYYSYPSYSYYYSPPVYYYSTPYYYCPIAMDVETDALSGGRTPYSETQPPPEIEVPPPRQGNGSYRYDGGPDNPVPMPKADPEPMRVPQPHASPAERAVSVPAKPSKFAYPAYGEEPGRVSSFAQDRTLLVGEQARRPSR
jgi:hypothetical protein